MKASQFQTQQQCLSIIVDLIMTTEVSDLTCELRPQRHMVVALFFFFLIFSHIFLFVRLIAVAITSQIHFPHTVHRVQGLHMEVYPITNHILEDIPLNVQDTPESAGPQVINMVVRCS